MKSIIVLIFATLLSSPMFPQGSAVMEGVNPEHSNAAMPSCVILKRMGPADQITSHMYSFGIRGKQFQYVEGELPPGVKFHGRLTDNDLRNIQKKGGRFVIMEPKYSDSDLREAKQSCKDQ